MVPVASSSESAAASRWVVVVRLVGPSPVGNGNGSVRNLTRAEEARRYRLRILRATCLTGSTRSSLWPIWTMRSTTTPVPVAFL